MSSINHRTKRRRRKPIQPYRPTNSVEEKLLQQAIQNSKDETSRHQPCLSLPAAPVFYPTIEEFEGNPIHYIERIRPIAEAYGICKIVPPVGWNPPFCVDKDSKTKFQTKEQLVHRLQEGISFGDGEEYNVAEYEKMAIKTGKDWRDKHYPNHQVQKNVKDGISSNHFQDSSMSLEKLEKDYWDIVSLRTKEVTVEYGNDVDTSEFGSGFPYSERGRCVEPKKEPKNENLPEPKFGTKDYYKETWWNLNNIPCAPDSILRHVRVGVTGINVPWLYFGCLFATFCWHNEDNYLYSINYHHRGAPKQWYGVPGTKKDADGLERVFRAQLSMKMRDVPDLLHHITTMLSPKLLQNGGVPVCKLTQYAGEFVVTFPRSFHSGFSYGPNVGEAVNFACHDWIAYGADANERYRTFARPAVFSHDRLTFTMANHLQEQKKFSTCKLLLDEIQRVVAEELSRRKKLIQAGVRDVSDRILLPKNRHDQLDEDSANYDDKRLCHACKHICFFSAVACECSQSKVSCLRHSHYMCRCSTERKYLMVWSSDDEMKKTLDEVTAFCKALEVKAQLMAEGSNLVSIEEETSNKAITPIAPGATRDKVAHMNEKILDVSKGFFHVPESFLRFRDEPQLVPSLQTIPLSTNQNQGAKRPLLTHDTSSSTIGSCEPTEVIELLD